MVVIVVCVTVFCLVGITVGYVGVNVVGVLVGVNALVVVIVLFVVFAVAVIAHDVFR